jgi:hypothetical protein
LLADDNGEDIYLVQMVVADISDRDTLYFHMDYDTSEPYDIF